MTPLLPHRRLSQAQQKIRDELKEYRKTQPLSPCVDQTPADIEGYYRQQPIGAPAAVRRTQYGLLEYRITEIEGQNPASGRVYILNEGAFYFDGRNCFHPHGQTTLVVPTKEVLSWAAEHPRGESHVATYRS